MQVQSPALFVLNVLQEDCRHVFVLSGVSGVGKSHFCQLDPYDDLFADAPMTFARPRTLEVLIVKGAALDGWSSDGDGGDDSLRRGYDSDTSSERGDGGGLACRVCDASLPSGHVGPAPKLVCDKCLRAYADEYPNHGMPGSEFRRRRNRRRVEQAGNEP
jgi:hypothetical protein